METKFDYTKYLKGNRAYKNKTKIYIEKQDQTSYSEQIRPSKNHIHKYKYEKHRHYHHDREERIPNYSETRVSTVEYDKIPDNINTIYLDGNNMLFCESAIRNLVLSRMRLEAEKVLANIAYHYNDLEKRFRFIVVYDYTSLSINQKLTSKEGNLLDFTVLSAGPSFNTSDDALVAWANEQGTNMKNCMFVTSDRGLHVRLSEAGVTDIMKPGRWLRIVEVALGREKYQSLMSEY